MNEKTKSRMQISLVLWGQRWDLLLGREWVPPCHLNSQHQEHQCEFTHRSVESSRHLFAGNMGWRAQTEASWPPHSIPRQSYVPHVVGAQQSTAGSYGPLCVGRGWMQFTGLIGETRFVLFVIFGKKLWRNFYCGKFQICALQKKTWKLLIVNYSFRK